MAEIEPLNESAILLSDAVEGKRLMDIPRTAHLHRRAVLAFAGAGLLTTLAPSLARAASLDRLRMIIPQTGGSTNDLIARALADAMRHDHPDLTIDVENDPGSSGRSALRVLLSQTGNGGLIGVMQNSLLYVVLQDTGDLLQQFETLTFIGALGADRRALFVAKSTGIATFSQLVDYGQPLNVPANNATSGTTADTAIINALTGARLRAVPGYSSSERKLALLSGEANAAVGSISSFSDLVDQGVIVPVLRLNDGGPGAPYPDVPLLGAVAKGPDAEVLVAVISALATTQQLVVAPPQLSTEQTDVLSGLFDAAAPQLASLPRYGAEDIAPFSREQVRSEVLAALSLPGAGDALRRAVACGQLDAAQACD